VPTVVRARSVQAPQQAVWDLVSDPYHLPRWWPTVDRVEDVSDDAWTAVATSSRGRNVRFDYTRVYREEPNRVVWRQELAQTPFERYFRESLTGVVLDAGDGGGTLVELRMVRKLRGLARFGSLQIRGAMRRELDGALDQLAQVTA
jgi:uncharacterized protein YndB with AHSA1/START domain